MGGCGGRKVKGGGKARRNKDHRSLNRTIHKGRWDDICAEALAEPAVVMAQKTKLDSELPGTGQYHCLACAKYCIGDQARQAHKRSVKHRRREKTLTTETPYSHAEANAAAGRAKPSAGRPRGAAPASSEVMDES